MVSKLTKQIGNLMHKDETEKDESSVSPHKEERRKSARLNNKKEEGEKEDVVHDSGTESDDEELDGYQRSTDPDECVKDYNNFLAGGDPPYLSSEPPVPKDDTESWYSFGRESGIMTGDNDSDAEGAATPTMIRKRMKDTRGANADDMSVSGAEKRRHSMTLNDAPIAWRLRSFTTPLNEPAVQKQKCKRCPVHVLINRPTTPCRFTLRNPIISDEKCEAAHSDEELEGIDEVRAAMYGLVPPQSVTTESSTNTQDAHDSDAPKVKRNRRNSNRPSLDFDKMIETRIESDEPSAFNKPVTRNSKHHQQQQQ